MQYTSKYTSRLGEMLLASDGENLTGLWFFGQKYFASNLDYQSIEKDLPIFSQTKMWLDTYFAGEFPSFLPSISLNGNSEFRERVLKILLQIPYGKTTTYGAIAKQIENETCKRASAQAVGGAVGHNPIAILIPCHRVLGSNKKLIGYAGGINKKIELLKLENVKCLGIFPLNL